MSSLPDLVQVASLIGDPSRAAILTSLMDGRMRPAGELARLARISPQTASSHLAKLAAGGLVAVEAHGRHRYYRLASTTVAQVLEGLIAIAPPARIRSLRESDQARQLRYARTCYDHLAGEVGVNVTQALLEREAIRPAGELYEVTERGARFFAQSFGIELHELNKKRRPLARPCLDWSERRHHLAGALGSALASRLFERGWIKRLPATRAVAVTEEGRKGLKEWLGVDVGHE